MGCPSAASDTAHTVPPSACLTLCTPLHAFPLHLPACLPAASESSGDDFDVKVVIMVGKQEYYLDLLASPGTWG